MLPESYFFRAGAFERGRALGLAAAFFTGFAAGRRLLCALSALASAAGFVSAGLLASFASAAASLGASGLLSASSPAARLRLPSWSDLKSVSYQPPPFRRNTGADTSFLSVCFLQLGHFRIGA